MIDKEAIRAAAEAATPGPWRPEIGDDYADVTLQDGQPLADCHYIDKRCFDTARYIARMDPATTLALLDELEAKRCACKWEGDDATVCELCMAHRFVVEAQVSPYRTDLATATEALREIGNQKGDVFAIRGEFPERTIPVVELSNTVLRCAKIAGDALAKLTETKPPDAGDTVLLRQPPEEV